MPLISIIVPVYKVELYLHSSIDSILAQTLDDFELILVDDGSPDRCGQICDEYAQQDSRVRVIHKENGGLSSARNAGIDWAYKHSDSQWLCFVDSDDRVDKHFLEYLYRAAIDHDVQISACDGYRPRSIEDNPEIREYMSEKKNSVDILKSNSSWATVACNKLYSKSVFAEYRYPVGRLHEDAFLTYKLLYNAKVVAWVNAPLYIYYCREGSITNSWSMNRLDALDAVREQIAFFKDKDQEVRLKKCYLLIILYNDCLKNLRRRKEYNDKYRELHKELKMLISRYKKVLKLNIFRTPQVYTEAYPKFMAVYWGVRRVLSKCKRFLKGKWN